MAARNANEAMVAPMVGCGGVCAWQNFAFSRHEDVSRLLQFKEVNKYTFNAMCKDNNATKCTTVQDT
jgi:hypothetical protein